MVGARKGIHLLNFATTKNDCSTDFVRPVLVAIRLAVLAGFINESFGTVDWSTRPRRVAPHGHMLWMGALLQYKINWIR